MSKKCKLNKTDETSKPKLDNSEVISSQLKHINEEKSILNDLGPIASAITTSSKKILQKRSFEKTDKASEDMTKESEALTNNDITSFEETYGGNTNDQERVKMQQEQNGSDECTMDIIVDNIKDMIDLNTSTLRKEAPKHGVSNSSRKLKLQVGYVRGYLFFMHFHPIINHIIFCYFTL